MPTIESTQHKLSRVRPPRVQITYDVEIGDAIEKVELPFVMGIMADLSGNNSPNSLPDLKDRSFVEIDRDNFNQLLRGIKPGLSFSVPSHLPNDRGEAPSGDLGIQLTFGHIDDFDPLSIVKQVKELNELYEERQELRDLLAKLEVQPDLLAEPDSTV